MMCCPHCGQELPEETVFCPHCGESLVLPEPDASSAVELTPPEGLAAPAEDPTDIETESTAAAEEVAEAVEKSAEETPAKEADEAAETPPEDTPAEETEREAYPAREKKEEPTQPEPGPKKQPFRAGAAAIRDSLETAGAFLKQVKAKLPARRRKTPAEKEARKKRLHKIAMILTCVGLLILLGVALALIFMSSSIRRSRGEGEESFLPAKPGTINFYAPVDSASVESEGLIRYVDNELIAISAEGVSYTEMERLCDSRNLRIIGCVELADAYQLRLDTPCSLGRLERMAAELEREDLVDCAMPNLVWEPGYDLIPADPWGESVDWDEAVARTDNWGLVAIRAPESWETETPGTVRMGLIDSVFDPRHEDLRFAALWGNEGYDRGACADDPTAREHGTAVASILGAIHDNGLGLSGVLRDGALCAYARPGLCGQMDLLAILAELADQQTPVVNCSLNYGDEIMAAAMAGETKILRSYYEKPAQFAGLGLTRLLDRGYDFLLVLPAGNDPEELGAEAKWNSLLHQMEEPQLRGRILVVGAAGLNRDGSFYQAPFSKTGGRVDVLAPGVQVYCALPNDAYARRNGTSLAAAYAAGMCARIWALHPGLSGQQIRDLAVETARTPVNDSELGLINMAAATSEAAGIAEEIPVVSERDRAMDAYAALLRSDVSLRTRVTEGRSGSTVTAQNYSLLDMNGDGVEELLLYSLDERETTASFALYAWQNGELRQIADAWDTCRFSSWANAVLTLEIRDGKEIYAGVEKSSAGYGETGEHFLLRYDGSQVLCTQLDRGPEGGERTALIQNSVLTDNGIRIGSAADELRQRD